MVELRRARRSEKTLAVTLSLVATLGSPARALAQTTGDPGDSGWGFPEEPAPPEAPAEPPPSPKEPAVPRRVEPPPLLGPRFLVTFSSGASELEIRGPGIDKPLTCAGTCTFNLGDGLHWLDIRASGKSWTLPVTVTGPQLLVVEAPNAEARRLGIAAMTVGGLTFSLAGLVALVILNDCRQRPEGNVCVDSGDAVPYWLAASGAGAVVAAIGIGVLFANDKPTVDAQPALGSQARRAPGTFVGLGPVEGSKLPGLSLRASF